MADDMLIGVGVKADFSSLKNEAKSASDALKQAEANWKSAFEQLGASAAQGSAQAQEALKGYEAELQQAQAKAASAAAAMAEVNAGAAASARAMAGAQAGAGAAASHTVPQFAAASGALRELQGNFDHNIRAGERFLTTTLGLGPALEAAFPVVGALALVGILFEVGKSLVKVGDDAASLGRELGGGWLLGAAAEMHGFGNEIKQTDEELMKLAADRDREKTQKQSLDVENVRLHTNVDTYKQKTQGLGPENSKNASAYSRAASEASSAGEQAADDLKSQQLQERIDALEKTKALQVQIYEAIEKQVTAQDAVAKLTHEGIGKLRKDQEEANAHYKDALGEQINLIEEKNNLQLKGEIAGQRETRTEGKGAGNGADEARMRADKIAFDQLKISHELTLEEEQAFWQTRLANYSKASSEYAEIVGKLAQLSEQERKAEKKALDEEQEESDKIDEEVTAAWEKDLKQQEEAAQAATRSAEIQIEAAAKVAEARVQYDLATSAITKQKAAYELAQIKAKAYGDQIKVLEEELRRLQQIDGMGGNTENKQAEVQDRIFRLQSEHNAALIQQQQKAAAAYTKDWNKAFDSMNQVFAKNTAMWITGQESLAKSWAKTLEGMTQTLIENLLKQAVAYATAAATQEAQDARSKMADAAKAARGAYTAVVGIPIIGPVLAPAAAAVAFAAVEAFANGGVVGGPFGSAVPIVAHSGERVMTSGMTNTFDRVMSNASAGQGPTNNSTVNARVNQHFYGGKASSAQETQRSIQNLRKRGKL
jgi:uncharacterized coiled-coil protein SlyX